MLLTRLPGGGFALRRPRQLVAPVRAGSSRAATCSNSGTAGETCKRAISGSLAALLSAGALLSPPACMARDPAAHHIVDQLQQLAKPAPGAPGAGTCSAASPSACPAWPTAPCLTPWPPPACPRAAPLAHLAHAPAPPAGAEGKVAELKGLTASYDGGVQAHETAAGSTSSTSSTSPGDVPQQRARSSASLSEAQIGAVVEALGVSQQQAAALLDRAPGIAKLKPHQLQVWGWVGLLACRGRGLGALAQPAATCGVGVQSGLPARAANPSLLAALGTFGLASPPRHVLHDDASRHRAPHPHEPPPLQLALQALCIRRPTPPPPPPPAGAPGSPGQAAGHAAGVCSPGLRAAATPAGAGHATAVAAAAAGAARGSGRGGRAGRARLRTHGNAQRRG
jgi:hypothetical protein